MVCGHHQTEVFDSPSSQNAVRLSRQRGESEQTGKPSGCPVRLKGHRESNAGVGGVLLQFETVVPEDDKYEASCGSFSLLTGKTTSTQENAVRVRAGLKDLFEVLHRTAKIEEDFLAHHQDAWISAWVLS